MAAISGTARMLVVRPCPVGTGLAGLAGTTAADIIYLFSALAALNHVSHSKRVQPKGSRADAQNSFYRPAGASKMAKEYRCSRPVLWLVEKPKTIA